MYSSKTYYVSTKENSSSPVSENFQTLTLFIKLLI